MANTIDITKVTQYKSEYLYEHDLTDNPIETYEEVLESAQRDTDRGGNAQGVYKLIAYTTPAKPLATVTTL